jgi:hypothetical protein
MVVAGAFLGILRQMAGLDELLEALKNPDRRMRRDKAQDIERNRRGQQRDEKENFPFEVVSAGPVSIESVPVKASPVKAIPVKSVNILMVRYFPVPFWPP